MMLFPNKNYSVKSEADKRPRFFIYKLYSNFRVSEIYIFLLWFLLETIVLDFTIQIQAVDSL